MAYDIAGAQRLARPVSAAMEGRALRMNLAQAEQQMALAKQQEELNQIEIEQARNPQPDREAMSRVYESFLKSSVSIAGQTLAYEDALTERGIPEEQRNTLVQNHWRNARQGIIDTYGQQLGARFDPDNTYSREEAQAFLGKVEEEGGIKYQEFKEGQKIETWALDANTGERLYQVSEGARFSPNAQVEITNMGDDFGRLPTSLQNQVIELFNESESSRRQAEELSVMKGMTERADTGILTPVTLPIKQAFDAIGISISNDVPLLEALRSQQNQLALRLRNPDSGFGLTGNTSDRDIRFLKDAVPGIANTPEGNQAIAIIMGAKMRRDAELKEAQANFILDNESLKGWTTERNRIIDETPFFTDEEREFIESIARSPVENVPGFEELSPEEQEELRRRNEQSNASAIR